MSFTDVIKKSVLEGFAAADMSASYIAVVLVETFLIALYIFYVYRLATRSTFYNKNYAVSMAIISVVTAGIILAMQSNIVISLGMVGALSIVRFRTAVKEPVDTGFMFWGIAAGIMAGAGLYIVSIIASLCIGILYFVIYLMGFKLSNRYLLVLKYKTGAHEDVVRKLKSIRKFKVRSKSIFGDSVELSLEIDLKEKNKSGNIDTSIVDEFNEIDGIINASLIAYQNDFGE